MKHIRRQALGWYSKSRLLRSEKGIALVMVLILSLISLAIVATLIFLVTQGTRFSGFNKRYESAREAGYGGTDLLRALITKQGALSPDGNLISWLTMSSKSGDLKTQCDCGDTSIPDNITITTVNPQSCLCLKLCAPTLKTNGAYNWGTCDNNIDPTAGCPGACTYDLNFQLSGFGSTYDVYGKIVDTSLGNSDISGLNLGGTAVVASSGSISAPPAPYLYTIEITAQDVTYFTNQNLKERGRLSVLYAY